MESPVVLVLILAMMTFATAPAYSQTIYASENPVPAGSNVTLFSQTNVTTGAWLFNYDIIVLMYPGDQIIDKNWSDRVTYNSTTSSLTISSLREEDSGLYSLQALHLFRARLTLLVQEPIAAVVVNHTGGPAILDEPFTLNCELTGPVDNIQWWRNGQLISTDSTTVFDMGNKTLILNSVQHSDNGDYQCLAFNSVSNMTSSPYTVQVNYGPEMATIMGPNLAKTGDTITLNCYASSSPLSFYKWFFNDSLVANTSEYVTPPLTTAMDGMYTCIAYNNITGKNSTAYTMLTIVDSIIETSMNPAIEGDLYMLKCNATGPAEYVYWMKNGEPLHEDNRTVFDMDNKTVTFSPLELSDNGVYQCIAIHAKWNITSPPYELFVNYGPMKPAIEGPSMALAGRQEILSCSSTSQPPSQISWYFNSSLEANTSELVIGPLTLNMSGMYICIAFNNITGKNSTAYTMLTVLAPVTMASIKIVGAQPILNHTFTLTCETAGRVESIKWMHGLSQLYADNTRNLSMDNTTLTFEPVMHSDNGNYCCVASNPLSNSASEIFMLDVFYGPEMATIMGPNLAKTGDTITLNCYASSSPLSFYKWFFNDSLVANTSEYVTPPLTTAMDGMYTCIAYNNITGKNSTAYTMLTIVDSIIETSMNPAIEGDLYMLKCNATGPAEYVYWMKNGEPLHEDNRTVFDMDNKTVTFSPLELSDNGVYQCIAIHAKWNITSPPYELFVNYGPMKPAIEGPSMALAGRQEILSCSSTSQPPSQISWYFNSSLEANTSELVIGPLTLNMSGMYICIAFNNITGKNSTAYTMLTVLAPVTMASIKIVGAQPILNHTFTLTCETAGRVESIKWMHGLSQLYADNTRNLSMDNTTLTFEPVMHSDNGNYCCVASNPLSNSASEIFMLDVFYGPEMATIMGPNLAKTGDTITLNCYASSSPLSFYKWFFNDSLVANTSEYVTPPLTTAMDGMYTCIAYNNITGKNSTAYTMLTIVDSIIETSMNPAIEGDLYMLKCNATGPAEYVYWMKNGEPLHEDNRTVFDMDNKTVTFSPLELSDNGVYQCIAIHAKWNITSPPYELFVNFGPETPIINGSDFAETGSKAVFHCYAMSIPPSQVSWWFNGSNVANTSQFKTGPLSLNMSGEYTCMAYNYVTGKNSTNSKNLTVIEAIKSVVIRHKTVPISSENFTLTCEVTGPYDMIHWVKNNNNTLLNMNTSTANTHMSYHTINNTLHFTPVTKYNDGTYHCVAINKAGQRESPQYMLLVNYGPLNVSISGPVKAKVGVLVSLTCSADSRPDCNFYWFLNKESSAPLTMSSVITFSATKKNEGNYICKAKNPVTNITAYQTKTFAVAAHASTLHIPSQGELMWMGLFALSVSVLFN